MKYIKTIVLRVVMIICAFISAYLLLTSVISLKINDTHAMGRAVIDRVVEDSDNPNLKAGIQFLETFGLEETLLKQLPKKYQIDMSYADLYRLCEKYDKQGKLTVNDLNLSSKSKLEEIINEYLVKQVNNKLKERAADVDHAITIYKYSIFIVILLFLLAIILIALGRSSAAVPLVLASLGSFVALWYAANEMMTTLQTQVYSGIVVTLSQGIWAGLAIGVLAVIIWPILLKLTKGIKQ